MEITKPPTTDSAMYRTMHRQPADLRRLATEGWEAAARAADLLAPCSRLFLVGIGTSYHAALVGEWLFRSAGVDARAVYSFDFATYPELYPLREGDGVILLAHSGTKTYSSRSLERATAEGATAISIGSLTAEHPGSQLVLRTVERERSAAFTSSHTAAMFVLAQIVSRASGRFEDALNALPDQVEGVLARQDEIQDVARLAADRLVYATGAGPNAATALEVVIKAREAATAKIDGLPLEQFLHGPLITIDAADLAILVNVKGAASATATRVAEIARLIDTIGTPLWLVGQGAPALPRATVFDLPEIPELLSPILAVVPMQILAYQLAVLKERHPDLFRRDDPTYAAAISTLTL